MRRALCVSVALEATATDQKSGASTDRRWVDLAAVVDPQHPIEELRVALAAATGAPASSVLHLARSGRVPRPDRRLADVDLVDGDTITLRTASLGAVAPREHVELPRLVNRISEAAGTSSPSADTSEHVLEVLSGPAAHGSRGLRPGVNRVGRSFAADIQLDDGWVSRHELDIVVDNNEILVVPTRSANGVRVNGALVDGPVALAAADIVTVGQSRFVVRRPRVTPGRLYPGFGTIDFFRTPYRNEQPSDPGIDLFDAVPEAQTPRRVGVIMIIAPLFAGIGMYLLTGRMMFLMFMALSPIMALGRFVEDRRSGRKRRRTEVAEFRVRLATHYQLLQDAQAAERLLRSAAHPDLFEIERRATKRAADLWIRHRSAEDFCSLRLGIGRAPTHSTVGVKPGGDPVLHAESVAALAGLDLIDEVPITVDLSHDRILGIHGPLNSTTPMVSSLLIQAATLHSPEDLRIAVASHPCRGLEWAKWLPHVRPERLMLDTGQLAVGADAARALIANLNEIIGQRKATSSGFSDPPEVWPRWLVVVDGQLDLDKVEADRLLDDGPEVGVNVIWLADTASGVPRQATGVVAFEADAGDGAAGERVAARIWSTDTTVAERRFQPELATAARCERVARWLAPLRDATAALGASSLPSVVPLFDVLGVDRPDTDWVRRRWEHADRSGLRGRIGVALGGAIEVDLVHHGPHALIGGTSGAGKSELLQSMVLGLASQHPPHHLNFLFIDYKGGASSQVFQPLPHTVGMVTNLNEAMAMRALESLRAELRYRMTLLEGRAKDLSELARLDPEAPPSLVIICDEFATLVKEIPDFVTGIIDIAQRGRSLGVHLVLATQRPAGAVNENILANTNLRIALRTIDKSDSSSIIDVPDAAAITPADRGRFFMRVGPSSLVEVQSAFSGAPLERAQVAPIAITDFDRPDAPARVLARSTPSVDVDTDAGAANPASTQLELLVEVIADAYVASGGAELRRPWRDPLPERLTMADTLARLPDHDADPGTAAEDCDDVDGWPGTAVVLGLADYPSEQVQRPLVVDLAKSGGLVVFGSAGSGKTTLLRSLAVNAARDTEVVVIDGASRPLLGLRELPQVVSLATADDVESVTRLICVLENGLISRRSKPNLRPLLLLIDDWAQLSTNLTEASSALDNWLERLQNLIIEGRGLGVSPVITADRAAALSGRLQSAIGDRLVLRHSDPSHYMNYGIPSAVGKTLDLPPGRGLYGAATLVQIAVADVSGCGEWPAQRPGCGLGQSPGQRSSPDPVRAVSDFTSRPLPGHVTLVSRPRSRFDPAIDLGVADITGERVAVDLALSDLAIVGHPGSGRSTALHTALRSAVAAGYRAHVIGHGDSPMRTATGVRDLAPARFGFDQASVERVLERLAQEAERGADRLLVAIDDVELVDDKVGAALEAFGRRVRVVGSTEVRQMTGYSTNLAVGRLKKARNLVFLQPDDPSEAAQLSGARVRIRPGVEMVPGRALLIAKRSTTLFQIAETLERSDDRDPAKFAAGTSTTDLAGRGG